MTRIFRAEFGHCRVRSRLEVKGDHGRVAIENPLRHFDHQFPDGVRIEEGIDRGDAAAEIQPFARSQRAHRGDFLHPHAAHRNGFVRAHQEMQIDALAAAGRDLRNFGSPGEQRLALLALLLAEAETINAATAELKAKGVHTIVVLLHEGGAQSVGLSESSINSCTGMSGAVVVIDEVTNETVGAGMVLSAK